MIKLELPQIKLEFTWIKLEFIWIKSDFIWIKSDFIWINLECKMYRLHIYILDTSVNPRLLRHEESCDYTLSSFKQRNKNEIQKSIS